MFGKKICPGSDYHNPLPSPSSASGSPKLRVRSTEPRRPAGLRSQVAAFCGIALRAMHWVLGAAAPTPWGFSGGGQAVTGLGGHLLLCTSCHGEKHRVERQAGVMSQCKATSPEPQLLQKVHASPSSTLSSAPPIYRKCIYLGRYQN